MVDIGPLWNIGPDEDSTSPDTEPTLGNIGPLGNFGPIRADIGPSADIGPERNSLLVDIGPCMEDADPWTFLNSIESEFLSSKRSPTGNALPSPFP